MIKKKCEYQKNVQVKAPEYRKFMTYFGIQVFVTRHMKPASSSIRSLDVDAWMMMLWVNVL